MAKTPKKRTKKRSKRKKAAGARCSRAPVSAKVVQSWGYKFEHLASADAESGLGVSLGELFKRFEKHQQAWERGQFIRNLEKLAGTSLTVTQAAKRLGMASGQELRDLLNNDPVIRDVWDQARLNLIIESKTAVVEKVREGNQAAIKAIELFWRDEEQSSGVVGINFTKISMNKLSELFGVTRQSVHDWYTTKGLPRNGDGTFDLATTIKWFEEFTIKKMAGKSTLAVDSDPMRSVKADLLELRYERERGKLLDRAAVISGLAIRAHGLAAVVGKLMRDVVPLLENQSTLRIEEILGNWASEFYAAAKLVPDEIKLPKKVHTKLAILLEEIEEVESKTGPQ